MALLLLATLGIYLSRHSADTPNVAGQAESPASVGADAPSRSDSALEPLSLFQDTLADGSTGPMLVIIPGGEFPMGSPSTEAGARTAEMPQHTVTISRFALSRSEITFADYDRFIATTGRRAPGDGGWGRQTRPVINVSWQDASAYAQWLSAQTGAIYRLPSEAEWEYAARAGTTTAFSTGECLADSQANFDARLGYDKCPASQHIALQTQPVGHFAPNPFGLWDMHGNVWEWVADCHHASYLGGPTDGTAWLAGGDCSTRILRGGSWLNGAASTRSAARISNDSEVAGNGVGFRLARAL